MLLPSHPQLRLQVLDKVFGQGLGPGLGLVGWRQPLVDSFWSGVRTLAAGPRQRGDGRGGRGRYLAGTDLGVGLEPLEDTPIFL